MSMMSRRRDSESGRFGGFRVFVGDIGHRVGRSDLEKEFGQYGPVTDVWMVRRRDQGMQGFAFVVFRYPEDADEAVRDKNGRTLYGRQVRVEHAKPVDGSNNARRDSGSGRGFYGGGPRGYVGDYGPPRGGVAPQRGRSRSRSRERYRRSPSPEYMRNANRRPPSPPMERRRHDSYNEPPPRKQLRISPSQSPEVQSRDRKNNYRRVPRSPPPPPPKKSSNHQHKSEDQSTSSSSDSSSPSPPPKKKKKKRKKHRRARSTSNSSSGYNAEDYKMSQGKHIGGKKLKSSKRKEKKVAKNDSFSSSDS